MHPSLTHSLTRAVLDDRTRALRHVPLRAMPHVDEPGSAGVVARLATTRGALLRRSGIAAGMARIEANAHRL